MAATTAVRQDRSRSRGRTSLKESKDGAKQAPAFSAEIQPAVGQWVLMRTGKKGEPWSKATPALVSKVQSSLAPKEGGPKAVVSTVHVIFPNPLALLHGFGGNSYKEQREVPLKTLRPFTGNVRNLELKLLACLQARTRASKREAAPVEAAVPLESSEEEPCTPPRQPEFRQVDDGREILLDGDGQQALLDGQQSPEEGLDSEVDSSEMGEFEASPQPMDRALPTTPQKLERPEGPDRMATFTRMVAQVFGSQLQMPRLELLKAINRRTLVVPPFGHRDLVQLDDTNKIMLHEDLVFMIN